LPAFRGSTIDLRSQFNINARGTTIICSNSQELQKGDLRQASEKVWGACALAIKAHAAARKRLVPKSHADLWLYKDEVANELGEWIRGAFLMADSMHKNFFEGLATAMDVAVALGEVEKLVKAIREVLK
jgi:PaREP1/PaREP8 domain containing family protein